MLLQLYANFRRYDCFNTTPFSGSIPFLSFEIVSNQALMHLFGFLLILGTHHYDYEQLHLDDLRQDQLRLIHLRLPFHRHELHTQTRRALLEFGDFTVEVWIW